MKNAKTASAKKMLLNKSRIFSLVPKEMEKLKGGSIVIITPPPTRPGSFGCI